MNYYQLLEEKAARMPQKILFWIDEKEYTYQAVLARTDALAEKLSQISPASRVLIQANGLAAQAIAFFSLQKLYCLPILLHHGLQEDEIKQLAEHNHLQAIVRMQEEDCAAIELYSNHCTAMPHTADCLGVLSSGSTGIPKVMYRTYDSWSGFFPIQNKIFAIHSATRLFLQGNLSFTGNLNSFLSILYEGGSIISSDFMHCRGWIRRIRQHQADTIYMVPAKLQLMLAYIKEPLSSVRMVFTGSQILPPQALKRIYACMPHTRLLLYYGASELNYITYADCIDPEREPRNLGKPFPGVQLLIKNGLIYVDTKYHVSGISMPFSVEDTGYLNQEGELIFQGRQQEWVNKGGFKISCAKTELALREISGISNAAALSCNDSVRGDELAVFIVLQANADQGQIRQAIRQKFSPVEMPGRILFVDAIPLNDRGKVNKTLLLHLMDTGAVNTK